MVYGRERKTAYDREYEQAPPTVTEPALVPPLLRQDKTPGSNEFTATLFDCSGTPLHSSGGAKS